MKVNIRQTHPLLYHQMMIHGVFSVWQAFNFLFAHPTFNPFGISKYAVGVIYLLTGTATLLVLNRWRRLLWLRIVQVAVFCWGMFWAAANVQQFVNGGSSVQLPIDIMWTAALCATLLLEPVVNPLTEKAQ